MLKLVNFIFLLFLFITAAAQNHHFIFFESQNNKPFVIKYENKIYSSTKKNFINLSRIENDQVQIKVEIENEKDLNFTINLKNNDAGYVVKQNANNDWVLFDILNFNTIVQDKFIEKIVSTTEPKTIESSSSIDSIKITNSSMGQIDSIIPITKPQNTSTAHSIFLDSTQIDSLIFSTTQDYIKTKQLPSAKEISISLLDSAKLANTTLKNENLSDTLKENNTKKLMQESLLSLSKFEKIFELINPTGIEQTFIEKNGTVMDTINIFIPIKKTVNTDTLKEINIPKVEEKKMVSNNIDVIGLKENNCSQTATELDFNNFTKELQKTAVIKSKLNLAAAILNTKCYTTSQIQRLSVLFMYDKAKLDFFKLAFSHIADIKNFHFLENEIKDESMRQEFLELLKP